VSTEELLRHGLQQPFDQLEGRYVDVSGGAVMLRPYDRLWLV
jgi:hypothetical protein